MARGTQLTELIEQLRAEIGHSVDPNIGVDMLEPLRNIIRRTQEWLYDDYDWTFLRVWRNKDMAAGQRYYDYPTDINVERIEEVWARNNGVWIPITNKQLVVSDYNTFDSDNDVRSSPVQKWRVYDEDQFEAWPIPSAAGDAVKFVGIRTLTPMVDDSDRALLDDRLITLFAAAERLARSKATDAKIKLDLATERLSKLKKRSATKDRVVVGGGSSKNVGNGLQNIRVIVSGQS